MNDKSLPVFGQIGGYTAGVLSWLEHADNIVGLIGTLCAASLSVWALFDKIKKSKTNGH